MAELIPVVADGTDQAAFINDFMANSVSDEFELPAGEFWIAESVFVPEGKTLRGAGQDQTVIKVLPEFGPLPGYSALVVGSNATLSDLTVDVNKVNNGLGTALRVCGVIGTGENFLVENVTSMNVTGYAFWANGIQLGTPASGVFRNVTTENASIHYETTHADGVLFEGLTATDGDGDIPCYSVFHPAGDSNNITYKDAVYVGVAQSVNVVAVIGDQTNIVFDNVHAETLGTGVAVWISGPAKNEVSFVDSYFSAASGNGMNAYNAEVYAENTTFAGGAIGVYIAPDSTGHFVDSHASASTPPTSSASAFALYGGPITWDGGSLSVSGGGAGTRLVAGTATISPQTVTIADDYATAYSNAVQTVSVLANDSGGAGGTPSITEIEGFAVGANHQVVLASGAIVTLNPNGTLRYDPAGAFDHLPLAASGPAGITVDRFEYTLDNGHSATVHVTVRGTADQIVVGQGAPDTITGGAGTSELYGQGGNDVFNMGANLTARDYIDGGVGEDRLILDGRYNTGVKFDATTLRNVEIIELKSGRPAAYNAYNLSLHDGTVAAGETLTIDGRGLKYGEAMMIYGSAEKDGSLRLYGGDSNDFLFGGQGADYFEGGLGNDTLGGGGGADVFFYDTIEKITGDKIDGGAGLDTLVLNGAFNKGVNFSGGALTGVERIDLQSAATGYNLYNLTLGDTSVAAGQSLEIDGLSLRNGETMMIYGQGEADGSLVIRAGGGADYLFGGAQDDVIQGGMGADYLVGNGGADRFVYNSAAESTGAKFDRIIGFNFAQDILDTPGAIAGFAGHVQTGSLDAASFDANLADLLSGVLSADALALVTPDAGAYAGRMFAVIDLNGDGAYSAGQDLVIELVGATNLPVGFGDLLF